ncbi:MAG: histidine kinase [Lachnospiraceae bacterium]|nr:histidine kinase [Lachnospiraceae bacterium]
MRARRFHSTFTKMTAFYIGFGMIPLVLISLMFFFWYHLDVMQSARSNYSQIADYVERNVSDLLETADETAGYLYDYSAGDYQYLYQILEDPGLSETGRQIYIDQMLQDMLQADPDISSVRFYREDGTSYLAFRVQGKNAQSGKPVLNGVEMAPENYHQMILMPTVSEEAYYTNTTDRVFSLVRSYMNTASVRASQEQCMGAVYLDINETAIAKRMERVNVGSQGSIAVLDPEEGQWLYASVPGVMDEEILRKGLSGRPKREIIREGKYWYFCCRVSDTDYYVVIRIFSEDVMDTYIKNRTYIFVILLFAILLLSLAYLVFSGRMNGPVRRLKNAMQQVQTGNLNVRVDIRTGDDMEYLGEGFNRMVSDLGRYIEEVYIANVCQKEAELNALKMQIQPHYLYNTLDVIRMTAVEQKDMRTARLLEGLGKQLRYVMGQQGERVPLYMELNSIQGYLVLMNARYQNKFQVNVNVADEDRGLLVLKLLLQPVVENSIKHGLRDKEGTGTLELNVKRLADCLEIVVMDDGVGMTPEETERLLQNLEKKGPAAPNEEGHVSVGLKNVYDRIKFTCGEAYGFTVASVAGMGTMVKYRLPVWEEEDDVEDDLSGR